VREIRGQARVVRTASVNAGLSVLSRTRPGRPLLWLVWAVILLAAASITAVLQAPHPNPFRTSESLWEWWRYPIERNAWQRLAFVGADLHRVRFLKDGSHGWAVGSWGTVLATRNGGASWFQQGSGTNEHLFNVEFLDRRLGWAVGANGTFLTTTNGGTSWSNMRICTNDLNVVHFLDARHGWAAGSQGAQRRRRRGPHNRPVL
jgi:hypothetical protein